MKKLLALTTAAALAVSGMSFPAYTAFAADYGTTSAGVDGSLTLYFGAESITQSGGGTIADDTSLNSKRTENLRTDASNTAVLTLPEVDLNGKGYTAIDVYAASKKNAKLNVKIGDTPIAELENINNSSWDSYKVSTAALTSSTASGNLTITITGEGAKTYCGNYVYVKLYNGGEIMPTASPTSSPAVTKAPMATAAPGEVLPYQDESLSFEERAADLVSRMTLEEKVAQLGYTAPAIPRLGVSGYNYWKECLHGVARQGKATNFPAPLALSNTWNRDLVYKVADITSTEARGKNNKTNLSYYTPTINMARDPRWGRNEETYGEDPYLTGQLGGEFVKGMQGNDDKYVKIIATIKHFAANNNEAYRRGGSSIMNEYNFRNYYLKPFENVSEIEMPGSVMSSYNATTLYRNGQLLYNYKPSAANTYLLTDVLRRTWGFDGYVTTDCGAGNDLIGNASYMNGVLGTTSADSGAYIAAALLAGMDLECNLSGGNSSVANGVDAVLEGYISEQQLETNIYHLFLQRFKTGEFDSNPSYRDIDASVIETDENVAAAEQAAEESWVLLKNDDNALPITNKKNVAVVGNLANSLLLGDYTGSPEKIVKPIDGLKEEFGKQGTEINYLGGVTDDEKLFNIKSITLVKKDGSKTKLDLSKAAGVSGMTLSNGALTDVTPVASAYIKDVNFQNVVSVEAEMSTGAMVGGSLNIAYGKGGPTVAAVSSSATADSDTYAVCSGDYTGEDGGYNGTVDMYISASAEVKDFSIEAYKEQLDAADVIIAYAGTIPKQAGFGDADASESHDRKDINLPAHQSHVQKICDAYPDKTVVVMSTVGQINVEPFMNKCKAILWNSYNGQTQGTALGKILSGEVSPSGRLSTTWYKNDDVSKLELVNSSDQTIGGIKGKYTNYDIQPTDTKPGNTYQYYKNTPIYPFGYGMSYTSFEYSNMTIDKTEADANDTVTVTVDVKNTGNVTAKDVVQLYVSHPQGNAETPKKQLKNFEKVELAPNETKTVTLKLDIADTKLFSEKTVKNEVLNGVYTIYAAHNADDTALSKTVNVSGTLDASLKTVKAMPDGISLSAYISEDKTKLSPINSVNANLSAVMNDDSVYDLSKAEVKYTSSNDNIAKVSESGVVTSGSENGTAEITAEVTVSGVTKTDTFPVTNNLIVANDDVPYVVDKVNNQKDGNVDVTVSFRGSTAVNGAVIKAEVLNADGSVKSEVTAEINGGGKYSIKTGAADGETVRYTVYSADGKALSESLENVYNEPIPSKINAYYLESSDYDYTKLSGGTDGDKYDTVNGLTGYGAWTVKGSKADYTYVDKNDNEYSYSFTKAWTAGAGGKTKRSFTFVPEGEGKVTAVFYGSESQRSMKIEQGSKTVMQEGTGAVEAVSLDITGTEPVYVYGGSSTKYLYAIIVEYYGMGDKPNVTASPSPSPTTEVTASPSPSPTTEVTSSPSPSPTTEVTSSPSPSPTTEVTASPSSEPAKEYPVTVDYDEESKTLGFESASDEIKTAFAAAVSYESGRMTGVKLYDLTFNSGRAEVENVELNSGDKVMVWNSREEIKPAANVFTYEAAEKIVEVQKISWIGSDDVTLERNTKTGETKLWQTVIGDQRVQIQTDIFYNADPSYHYGDVLTINAIDTYKGRLYAACDNGYVMMITDCIKCYQLKKPVEFDIKSMDIIDGVMEVSDGGEHTDRIDMSQLGGDSIEPDEASLMLSNGAVLIDLRDEADFNKSSVEGSVNIPIDKLEEGLKEYSEDTVIIFCCYSGTRAGKAIEKAKSLGYTNVYNLGSYEKLM